MVLQLALVIVQAFNKVSTMSNNAERIKFLKSARASIERDIASLEKRGGDSKAISGFKEKLAELDGQISKVEAQPQVNKDASVPESWYDPHVTSQRIKYQGTKS